MTRGCGETTGSRDTTKGSELVLTPFALPVSVVDVAVMFILALKQMPSWRGIHAWRCCMRQPRK